MDEDEAKIKKLKTIVKNENSTTNDHPQRHQQQPQFTIDQNKLDSLNKKLHSNQIKCIFLIFSLV